MEGLQSVIDKSYIDTGTEWHLDNIIIWVDGSLRPWRNHYQCTGIWESDGQVFRHLCPQTKKQSK